MKKQVQRKKGADLLALSELQSRPTWWSHVNWQFPMWCVLLLEIDINTLNETVLGDKLLLELLSRVSYPK